MTRERQPFPDLSRVRRVRIEDEPTPQEATARRMAQAANADREREGADDGTE